MSFSLKSHLHEEWHSSPRFLSNSFRHQPNSPHQSLSTLLNLKTQRKIFPKTERPSKYPIFAKFLQKSPDSQFQPMEEIDSAQVRQFLNKIEPVHLTQTTRKEGPARHRNTIQLKIHLINTADNIRRESEKKIESKTEILENLNNINNRNRARSSILKEKRVSSANRISIRQERSINSYYNEIIEKNQTSIDKKSFENTISSKTNKTLPEKNNRKQIKVKNMKIDYDICGVLKSITSNHFYNKIKEFRKEKFTEKNEKTHKKAKSNIFYQDIMMSHFFDSALLEKERERFSQFLMNDSVNKLILEKKNNNTGTMNEFLTNFEEIEKEKEILKENKKIREDFKHFNKINKSDLFHPQSLLNKFRESIHINKNDQIKKIYKYNNINNYLSSKDYMSRDNDFKMDQKALKNLKVLKHKKKKNYKKNIFSKENMWELRDSLLEYAKMVKNLGSHFSQEKLTTQLPRKPYETSGSYMFLKFVKKGKFAYLEKMLRENPIFIFNFNVMGHTALHIACIFGYSDIVELLIEHHARVNVKDVTGKTPLYYATKNNDYETILILFRNKARPWSTSNCDYKSLNTLSAIQEIFSKAKKIDIIKKITPKKYWTQEIEDKIFLNYLS